MTKFLNIRILFLIFIISCGKTPSNVNTANKDSTNKEMQPVDVRKEGLDFKSIVIDDQVWMAENLRVKEFRNGDSIHQARSQQEWDKALINHQPVWCYYQNDTENGKKYGMLYNWYAVTDERGLAPLGWHVPSDDEWTKMIEYLGGIHYAGAKMRERHGWKLNSNNESGLSCRPGGYRLSTGEFIGGGTVGYWWTSTETSNEGARYRNLTEVDVVFAASCGWGDALSVRCIMDK